MRVIIIGCEYSGTTTLGYSISRWAEKAMGQGFELVHDHWKLPHVINHPSDMTEEEQEGYLSLSLRVKEAAQRHNLYYHTPSSYNTDGIIVGYYFEDTIYADLYYGYGGKGKPGDREVHSKKIEQLNINFAPETILILTKATKKTIIERMKNYPHPRQIVNKNDLDLVMERFDQAFDKSDIKQKIILDTGQKTPEETLDEFVTQAQPFFTDRDISRMKERDRSK